MMAKAKLKIADTARSPARQALHDAIEKAAACERSLLQARAAIDAAGKRVQEAQASLEAAEQLVERARADSAARLAEAVTAGTTHVPDNSVKKARQAQYDSEDALDVERQALAQLEQNLVQIETELAPLKQAIERAADAVIVDEVPPAAFIEELKALEQQVIDKRLTLRFLGQHVAKSGWSNTGPDDVAINKFFLDHAPMLTFPDKNFQPHTKDWDRHPTTQAWCAARAALLVDADAPLPTL